MPATLARLLLTSDPRQRVRLAQSGLAAVLIIACVGVMHLAVGFGIADPGPLPTWSWSCIAGVGAFFLFIRSGWNLRLRDPSLTVVQMIYAIGCGAAGYTFAGHAHPMVLMMVAVILVFGMFGMTLRQVLLVAVVALLGLGGVMLHMAEVDPQRYPPRQELLYFLILSVMTTAIVILTARVRQMRERLRSQRSDLETAVAQIHRLATHDDLTGLVNRRHMQALIDEEHARRQRDGQPWCLAMIDLDHFKRVNDTHGHAIGDEVLRELARRSLALVRKTDRLGRWGGEEFVLLLTMTPLDAGAQALERVRLHFAEQPLVLPELAAPLALSFSAGITEHRHGETIAQTLERADQLAYRAKLDGRNRICPG